jgi:hypothetical protein
MSDVAPLTVDELTAAPHESVEPTVDDTGELAAPAEVSEDEIKEAAEVANEIAAPADGEPAADAKVDTSDHTPANGDAHQNGDAKPEEQKLLSPKSKLSVKPASSKPGSAPGTPLVKKVC